MLRLLSIWLLALALPLQGVAAATMQFCGAGHLLQTQLLDAAHSSGHAHHMDGGGDTTTEATTLAKFKCSACAACCMATALPPAVTMLPVVDPVIETTAVVPTTYVGPDTTGLERPPKYRLA